MFRWSRWPCRRSFQDERGPGRRAGRPRPKIHMELKQRRGLATRYDKAVIIYLAGLHLAAVGIWLAR